MSDDPRLDSTRRWSRGKVAAYILGIIAVFVVVSAVWWLPLLVGPQDSPYEEGPSAAAVEVPPPAPR
jgi:hypothetical protein